MTIETSGETTEGTTSEPDTNPGSGQDGTQTSTDQSQQEQQTPEQIAEAAAAAAANEPPAQTEEEKTAAAAALAADPYKFGDSEDDKKLKAFVADKTPAQLAKELLNAQSLLGKKTVGIPGKDSTPEEQRAFHKARGVPDDEKSYDLAPAMEELKTKAPDGWAPAPEAEQSFRKAAKLANLSQSEANEFAKHFLAEQFEIRKESTVQELAAARDATAMLAKEWGPDRTVGQANFDRGMRALGLPPDTVDVFLAAYGNTASARFNMVKGIAEIGRYQMEGGPIPGNNPTPGAGASMTKEQATAEIERIKGDPVLGKAFNDVSDPRHKEISREMGRLGKIQRGIQ